MFLPVMHTDVERGWGLSFNWGSWTLTKPGVSFCEPSWQKFCVMSLTRVFGKIVESVRLGTKRWRGNKQKGSVLVLAAFVCVIG